MFDLRAGEEGRFRTKVADEIGFRFHYSGSALLGLQARDGPKANLWAVPSGVLEGAVLATRLGLDPAVRERLAAPWNTYDRWIGLRRQRGLDWYRGL
jgi:hypothetical protein